MNENPFMPKEYDPANVESEILQLEKEISIDKELALEARKLGASLEDIQSSIEEYGVEEFKAHYGKEIYKGANEAGSEQFDDDVRIKKENEKGLQFTGIGAVLTGVSAFCLYAATNNEELARVVKDSGIDQLNEHIKSAGFASAILFMFGFASSVYGVSSFFEARSTEKSKKLDAIKFKLAGIKPEYKGL